MSNYPSIHYAHKLVKDERENGLATCLLQGNLTKDRELVTCKRCLQRMDDAVNS